MCVPKTKIVPNQKALFFCRFALVLLPMRLVVIQTGGKQYLVKEGDTIRIEKLSDTLKVGDAVSFDHLLLLSDEKETRVGMPHLADAAVTATIAEVGRGKKIEVVKYKAKSRYFKLRGHRQPYMKIKIAKV